VYLYHEVEGDWRVGPLIIGPPVFTIAWYRRETPYNLYTWFHPDGSFVAGYYNAVGPEGYVRAGAELRYRDLIMDLLVHPDGTQELLDEEEAGALASTQYDLARETMDKLTGQAAGRIAGCVAEAREIIASIDGSGT
jgi:predicted RNA-binding protein associated with RNAse of E/G family